MVNFSVFICESFATFFSRKSSVSPIGSHIHNMRLASHIKVKEKGKDQKAIQPSTTPDPRYHMEK